jgi:NAD(P)-dependent dehydrogenase (short-subunit alcohol dehydrogenase family)
MALSIDLSGKVAIVTGVSTGIGRGVVKMLAQAGADIAGCSKTHSGKENILQLTQEVQELGSRFLYCQADVTYEQDIARLVEDTIQHYGRIDLVVSNAGANVFEGASDCSRERWQFNLDLNLKSHWLLGKLCQPHMKQGGTLIIMTSNHAYATIAGCFPYNVTKTALTGLVRSLAIEWGPIIRVAGVAPGFIDTPGNDAWFASFPDPGLERKRTEGLHPAGRLGSPAEVGALCAFLASSYAAFITGTTFVMDGGRTAVLQDS